MCTIKKKKKLLLLDLNIERDDYYRGSITFYFWRNKDVSLASLFLPRSGKSKKTISPQMLRKHKNLCKKKSGENVWFEQHNASNSLIFWIKQVSRLESSNFSSVTLLTDGNIKKELIDLWLLLNFRKR